MNRGRVWIGRAVLVASVLANLMLAYLLIDRAMAADDRATEARHRNASLELLTQMTSDFSVGMKRSDLEPRLRARHPNSITKWEGDVLWVDEVGFRFTRDRVEAVVLMNPVER